MQEIIHSIRSKKGKKEWMAIKTDLEKAYDRLKWAFIKETLEDMQLPHLLIQVIMRCVTTCSLSILWIVNPRRGLGHERHLAGRFTITIPFCGLYGNIISTDRDGSIIGEVGPVPDQPQWAKDLEPPLRR